MRKSRSFSRCVAILVATALFAASAGSWPAAGKPLPRIAQLAIDVQTNRARATVSPRGGLIEWTTEFDNRILGFNVFRITRGQSVKLNSSLIAGPAILFAGRGQSFSWFDSASSIDSTYEVESVGLRGESLLRTTVTPTMAATLPGYRQTPLLADCGKEMPQQLSNPEWYDIVKVDLSNEIVARDTSVLSQQWSMANQPALKIGVRSAGWYRIGQPQLAAAGFDVTGDAQNLQLFVEGDEVAVHVSRDAGALSPSDFIEFWAQALDSPTSDTRVYWLVNGQQAGKRIKTSGNLRPDSTPIQPVVPDAGRSADAPIMQLGGLWSISAATSAGEADVKTETATAVAKQISSAILSPAVSDTVRIEPIKENPVKAGALLKAVSQELTRQPAPSAKSKIEMANNASASTDHVRSVSSSKARSRMRRKKTRMRRPGNHSRRHNHVVAANSVTPAFTYTTEYSNRSIYYTAALNGDKENFFGPVVFGNGPNIILTTRNIERTSTAPVQLTVSLQGQTLGTHQVNVLINGTPAGLISFSDQSSKVQTLSFPGEWLIDGDNVIKLAPNSPTTDVSFVDYIRVSYAHSFRAENDSLQFTVKATQSARVDGFTSADIRVVDVTDPTSVQIVRPIIDGSGNSFAATVPAGERGKARRFVALPAARISQPAWLTLNQTSTLNSNTNAAGLLIISHKNFIPALAPLVAQRQAQGYNVKTVDVEDVYDEFSFGEHTPQAIRDFMSLAKNTWARAPSYLLLVGDASLDPRNHLGNGDFDLVPTKLIDTGTAGTASALETASDDWLTDFNGNGIADIATGRLPVRTAAEANLVISKIVNYSPANTGNKALLVADTQGSYYFNFEAANDQVATTLPAGMTVQKVYRRLQPSDADARTNIIANLNSGQTLTVYSGHGNVNIWGGSIFTASDAAALTNGNRLSFVVVMDCLNGYFADPLLKSLAESFLSASSGGAVASFASSGLTIPDGQHAMGLEMFHLLYGGGSITIGDASRQAKLATNDMDVRRTWILFGDPTLKVR
jgi:hypothetical protein